MTAIDNLRNSIIEKLLTINNKEYLDALYKLVTTSQPSSDVVNLTEEQKLMLAMSETDIKEGKLILHDDLDKKDLEWLKQK